jgi:RNA polymerase sigma factor (sigma-70 family)
VKIDDMWLRAQLEQCHPEVFGWALSLCRYNTTEAENIVQTAYVNILAGKAVFGARASFRTWLFGVVRITALELRRREWLRRWRWITGVAIEAAPDPAPHPDERIDQDQRAARVHRALMELPPRQREVLQLVFYHELSIAEAAEVMAVSLGTARQHYERGKKRLREHLSGVVT